MFSKICDKQNIILERSSQGNFKISMNIEQNSSDSDIFETIQKGDFFDLLYELNEDIIKTYKNTKSEKDNTIDNVEIIFNNVFDEDIMDEYDEIYLRLKTQTIFTDNICKISGLNIDSVSNIENLLISMEKQKNIVQVQVFFDIIDNKISDIIKTYIGLYLKKIFYKIKMYFE